MPKNQIYKHYNILSSIQCDFLRLLSTPDTPDDCDGNKRSDRGWFQEEELPVESGGDRGAG